LTTTENFLFTPQTVLKARLPSLPPGHIEDLTAHCLAHTGPQVINGEHELEYQERMLSGVSWEGWGISNLDDLVDGWDGIGIVEIAGGKRVAKSVSHSNDFNFYGLIGFGGSCSRYMGYCGNWWRTPMRFAGGSTRTVVSAHQGRNQS
jgi:hypothetical protein